MARYNTPTVIVQPADGGSRGVMHPVLVMLLLGALALGALLLVGALRPAPEPEPAAVTPPPPTVIDQANANAIEKDTEMDVIERKFAVEREKAWARQVDIAHAFAGNFALGIGLAALAAATVIVLLRVLAGPGWQQRLLARKAPAAQRQQHHLPPAGPLPAAPPAQPLTVTIYVSGDGDPAGQAAVKHRRSPTY